MGAKEARKDDRLASAGSPTGHLYAHTHYTQPTRKALLIHLYQLHNCKRNIRRALSLSEPRR